MPLEFQLSFFDGTAASGRLYTIGPCIDLSSITPFQCVYESNLFFGESNYVSLESSSGIEQRFLSGETLDVFFRKYPEFVDLLSYSGETLDVFFRKYPEFVDLLGYSGETLDVFFRKYPEFVDLLGYSGENYSVGSLASVAGVGGDIFQGESLDIFFRKYPEFVDLLGYSGETLDLIDVETTAGLSVDVGFGEYLEMRSFGWNDLTCPGYTPIVLNDEVRFDCSSYAIPLLGTQIQCCSPPSSFSARSSDSLEIDFVLIGAENLLPETESFISCDSFSGVLRGDKLERVGQVHHDNHLSFIGGESLGIGLSTISHFFPETISAELSFRVCGEFTKPAVYTPPRSIQICGSCDHELYTPPQEMFIGWCGVITHEIRVRGFHGASLESDFIKWHEWKDFDNAYGERYITRTIRENYFEPFGEWIRYSPNDFLTTSPACDGIGAVPPSYIRQNCSELVRHDFTSSHGEQCDFILNTLSLIRTHFEDGSSFHEFELTVPAPIFLGEILLQSGYCVCDHELDSITAFPIEYGYGEHVSPVELLKSSPMPLGDFNSWYGEYHYPMNLTFEFLDLSESIGNFGEFSEMCAIRTLPGLYLFQKFNDKVLENEYKDQDGVLQGFVQEYKPYVHQVEYCHATLHEFIFEITDGELPVGLELSESGCISGVIRDLDQMNPTATMGPSHNWFGKNYDGNYVPYEFIFRFEITTFDTTNREKLDSQWFQIRVINNWDCDMDDIRSKIEKLSVEYIQDPEIPALPRTEEPVREIHLCPCEAPLVIGTYVETEQTRPDYKPKQMIDDIENKRKDMNNSLPMEMLFYHSESAEVEFGS